MSLILAGIRHEVNDGPCPAFRISRDIERAGAVRRRARHEAPDDISDRYKLNPRNPLVEAASRDTCRPREARIDIGLTLTLCPRRSQLLKGYDIGIEASAAPLTGSRLALFEEPVDTQAVRLSTIHPLRQNAAGRVVSMFLWSRR